MDDDSLTQAQDWANGVSTQILDLTWRAFDELREKHLCKVILTQKLEELERDLTSHHFRCINRLWAAENDGFASMTPQPEFPEIESRKQPPARSPAYDFAFIWNDDERFAWPIEAKVVQTPRALAEYMKDVQKYLSGTAAPLTNQGGIIAYLLSGESNAFFDKLQNRIVSQLEVVPSLEARAHRSSFHTRESAPTLTLHYLAMVCS